MKAIKAVAVCLLLFTGAGWAQQTATSQPFSVQQRFGADLSKVRATPDTKDDMELAKKMVGASRPVTATSQPSQQEDFRAAIALEALNLVMPIGSEDSVRVAEDALSQAMMIRPMDEVTRTKYERDIAVIRLQKSATDKTAPEDRTILAEIAGERLLDYADAMVRVGNLHGARDELNFATALVRPFDLHEINDKIIARLQDLSLETTRKAQVQQATQALLAAQATNNPSAIAAARTRLALTYLQNYGDVTAAAPLFKGLIHEYSVPLDRAARYLAAPDKFARADLVPTAQSLAGISDSIRDESARRKVAAVALQMVAAYLDTKTAPPDGAKVAELRQRLEKLSGQTITDKLTSAIARGYPGLQGAVTIIDAPNSIIKVSYPFASKKDLADFIFPQGANWKLAGGALTGQSERQAVAENRLVFDATKPVSISFRTFGQDRLETVLHTSSAVPFVADLADYALIIGFDGSGGGLLGPGSDPFFNDKLENHPNAMFQEVIEWDGHGGITWTVNGLKLTTWKTNLGDAPPKFLRLGLKTAGATTSWDDITIQGTVITDPMWATVANPPTPHEDMIASPPPPTLPTTEPAATPARPLPPTTGPAR